MTKLYAILIVLVMIFVACGDDYLANEKPVLEQYVFASFNKLTENSNWYPIDEFYVERGYSSYGVYVAPSVYFYAGYSDGRKIYTNDSAQQFYREINWKIGEDQFNINSFSYSFLQPGTFEGSLKTIDNYGDTLQNLFKIYVGEKNQINLDFPHNGYNQADPSVNASIPLRWTTTGIDPWEQAFCQVYAAYTQDSLWNSPIGSGDCDKAVSLRGGLIPQQDSSNSNIAFDSSFTIYWAVELITESESGKTYRDSSEIFHFSTKILNSVSTLKIPVTLHKYRDNAINKLEVTLVSARGDTLQRLTSDSASHLFSFKVEAQSGVKIFIAETSRKEYSAQNLKVDIPPNTVLELDTILLHDSVSPQISAAADAFGIKDSLAFLIYDDGSGIAKSSLQAVMDGDTLQSVYTPPLLKFTADCAIRCKIEIFGKDHSANSLPNYHWQIENDKSHYKVTGPFANEGY